VNTSAPDPHTVAVNDITIQSYGGGNDYGAEFFYLSSSDTQRQRDMN
jgi:hypothetical protein